MSGPVVRYVTFRDWAGIAIRGANPFTGRSMAVRRSGGGDDVYEWDVVLSAITEPEGGAYDPVVSYDGTAMTWGFAQWTFTSGRLQKLLVALQKQNPLAFLSSGVPSELQQVGLGLAPVGNLVDQSGRQVIDKDKLRALLTPPDGKLPRKGANYEYAARLARSFWYLGQAPGVPAIQEDFLIQELSREVRLDRPKLRGKSIASFLYTTGWPGLLTPAADYPELTAARALFWSMWQNGPRAAEEHLYRALHGKPFAVRTDLDLIAKTFARSQYGFWGNAKCGKTRKSRYWKVATAINSQIGPLLQPALNPDQK